MRSDLLNCVPGVAESKIKVIPNPLDFLSVEELSKEPIEGDECKYFSSDRPTLLCVGRLFPQKNYSFLIRSLSQYKLMGRDFVLIILGDGILKEELQSEIDMLGLHENIFLLGYKSNPFKYMRASDVFLLPSKYEGMSNSLIQSSYLNLRSLVSDSQETSLEVQRHLGIGSSYKQGDSKAFMESLDLILCHNKKSDMDFSKSMFSGSLDQYIETFLS
jgi:N-acetylgalactosamine-N,N'-diacetylbacillosaminyl-diphospho-undecaprenol 4-alpha-N-acetylgalactosaminyltransferase